MLRRLRPEDIHLTTPMEPEARTPPIPDLRSIHPRHRLRDPIRGWHHGHHEQRALASFRLEVTLIARGRERAIQGLILLRIRTTTNTTTTVAAVAVNRAVDRDGRSTLTLREQVLAESRRFVGRLQGCETRY